MLDRRNHILADPEPNDPFVLVEGIGGRSFRIFADGIVSLAQPQPPQREGFMSREARLDAGLSKGSSEHDLFLLGISPSWQPCPSLLCEVLGFRQRRGRLSRARPRAH